MDCLYKSANKYLNCWLKEVKNTKYDYVEPLLSDEAVKFVKYACYEMKQDAHVFLMSVDIIERYLAIKNKHFLEVKDPVLTVTAVVFLCSKFVGEQSDLRAKDIRLFLKRSARASYQSSEISHMELEVFSSLGGKLPLHTKIDDLNTFLEVYVKPMKLTVDINAACIKILELIYMNKAIIFKQIKEVYSHNDEALCAFQELLCNRLYLPAGILLCVLRLSGIDYHLNTREILVDLKQLTGVHSDHLLLLSNHLQKYVHRYLQK